ncbi:bifunctional oligoribonuclease and PAP phosphatase NrnA [Frankia sp. AiPs1]|uniref:DHH family phosphoesterase n=1 Tax=Frankia sp. AiPa1 TaxID=573492 RepID=UPI00202B1BBC|nr:DHH family phosphoesterase [Frankia sp. AiPa1]MCL9761520.1 DHH family phosphoesterase [Frankia sp. AiPa1]
MIDVDGLAADRAALVRALRDAVDTGSEILLVAHVNPDADSLGSALALGLALRRLGARARVSFDAEPFAVPRTLRFLAGQDLLVDSGAITTAPGLVVALDADSQPRLGRLARCVRMPGTRTAVIDHHPSNTRFGEVNLVDSAAPATSVLVVEVIDDLGVPLDVDMAAALYAGLVTDTGSFRFAATTAAEHRLAARLLETGIHHDQISRALWDDHPFGYVQLLGEVLERARLEPEHDLIWSWCEQRDLRAVRLATDETQGFIDILRSVSEAEVALICRQDDAGWSVSLRSRGDLDVGAVCVGLGGGGHRVAAGFRSASGLASLMDQVRVALLRAPRRTAGAAGSPGPSGPLPVPAAARGIR